MLDAVADECLAKVRPQERLGGHNVNIPDVCLERDLPVLAFLRVHLGPGRNTWTIGLHLSDERLWCELRLRVGEGDRAQCEEGDGSKTAHEIPWSFCICALFRERWECYQCHLRTAEPALFPRLTPRSRHVHHRGWALDYPRRRRAPPPLYNFQDH